MYFKIDNVPIKTVDTIKDLMIILYSKLLFEYHIQHTVQRAYGSLGFLLRTRKGFRSAFSLIDFLNSPEKPILEYSSVIWNPMY